MIAVEAITDLDAPVQRLATPDIPIPHDVGMMASILPNVE
jgi:pyruvate/2-oxoglutarate/acetoin dehydrogenase E1 component